MPNPRALLVIALAAVGGALAVGGMLAASETTHFPLLLIPFGTSILVVFGSPEATPAQPRSLIGGHLVSAAVGLLVLKIAGPHAWAAATAVGLSMVAMHLTRTFHPPAGIDPLIIVVNNMPLTYFLLPVAVGALTLALFAGLWHRLVTRVPWPERWW
ncbi:MAG: HPP family protein [Pseudolabrys sp.]|nr:HPP family protein [Pseudolabrys sp.]MCW5683958.1 HPP family protein [Pseudolabrys sp.]